MPHKKPTVDIQAELSAIHADLSLVDIQMLAHSMPRQLVGIYFLLNEGQIVYVGQSINIVGRVMAHFMAPKVMFDQYTYIELEAPLLNEAEWHFINKFQPVGNSTYRMSNVEYVTLESATGYFHNQEDKAEVQEYVRTYFLPIQGKYYPRTAFIYASQVLRKERHERLFGKQ